MRGYIEAGMDFFISQRRHVRMTRDINDSCINGSGSGAISGQRLIIFLNDERFVRQIGLSKGRAREHRKVWRREGGQVHMPKRAKAGAKSDS